MGAIRCTIQGFYTTEMCDASSDNFLSNSVEENEEHLIEDMLLEDSMHSDLPDEEDVAESEDSRILLEENSVDDTLLADGDDEELDDVQEESLFGSRRLILINQCGSYGKTLLYGMNSLPLSVSEVTVDCGNCTSISLKGKVNAYIEFCTQGTKESKFTTPSC